MSVFQKGFKDFFEGNVVNPYNEGTSRHKNWEMGFNKAYFTNLKKVQENERKNKS